MAVRTVDQAKAEAERLDRKCIRIAGYLSTHHFGVSLVNSAGTNAVRVRFPREVGAWRGKPRVLLPSVQPDELYRAFEEACRRQFPFEAPHTFAVELDALVLVLKSDVIYIRTEAPVEVVPLRVRSIKLLLLPPPPIDDPWWTF